MFPSSCTFVDGECSSVSMIDKSKLESAVVFVSYSQRISMCNDTLDKNVRVSNFTLLFHRDIHTSNFSRRF